MTYLITFITIIYVYFNIDLLGTCSLKLRGSVFSALASAHWGCRAFDKSIACMQQDLAIVKALGKWYVWGGGCLHICRT